MSLCPSDKYIYMYVCLLLYCTPAPFPRLLNEDITINKTYLGLLLPSSGVAYSYFYKVVISQLTITPHNAL